MNTKWINFLKENDACEGGFDYAKDMEPQEFWEKCDRVDWMFWVLKRITVKSEKVIYVKIAIDCAELVLHLCKNIHEAKKAIEAAKNWIENPCEQTKNAAYVAATAVAAAAYAAYTAANNAAYAASYTAYTAAYADADADVAYTAVNNAAYAVSAAYAASVVKRKKFADIVKKHIPNLTEDML